MRIGKTPEIIDFPKVANASRLGELKFDDKGLIPVIAQDARSHRVLMLAWANREAIDATLRTGYVHYYSRSRQSLWRKGETSGNVQKCLELVVDCDQDTLLAVVEQTGPACHKGTVSCFDQSLEDDVRV